ncbi:hypothetical protein [Paenibacillus naphthalenovorans]|uniref:hypothetical protein n=1 Tax=Paenibacillus naphthalenovorans TaxID=162209 RepID=UPI00088042B4|nr:hypothetical protein [Paenibacillus naphthalenovorans]SDJ61229.1 hypothetical protein SAMN05421868_13437 [Paenibacillus naphthalenovorans]
MAKYRKKPVVIEAIQWRANEMLLKDVIDFFGGMNAVGAKIISKHRGNLIIKTIEGSMTASDGDWIIKGVNGEFYPCKPDIFEKTYEMVE